jgi:hypothetical protein
VLKQFVIPVAKATRCVELCVAGLWSRLRMKLGKMQSLEGHHQSHFLNINGDSRGDT